MRVLVTGGAGFIGATLVARLVGAGEDVVVLDDLSTGSAAHLAGLDVDLRVASVTDAAAVRAAVSGCDAVVHLAAVASVPASVVDPLATHEVNATGTLLVCEAARPAGAHVLVASSAAVYGDDARLPTTESQPPAPRSPYAASKLAAESYALAAQHVHGLPVLALRFFNVYGPLQSPRHAYAAVVPAFVDAALGGRPATVHGDGGQTRDLTMVDTVAAVLADAVDRRVTSPGPVNLAYGTRTSLLGLLAALGEVLGREVPREHLPPRAGDVRHSQADGGALAALFPDVAPVPLRAGLERTVAWARGRHPGAVGPPTA